MRHHGAGGGAEQAADRDGGGGGNGKEDCGGEQGRSHRPGGIPETAERTGRKVRGGKGRVRKGIRGDFRQAGEAENLYAVHRRAAKAGRLLREV